MSDRNNTPPEGGFCGDPPQSGLCALLADNPTEPIFRLDPSCVVHDVNMAATLVLGFGRGELLGRTFADLVLAEDRAELEACAGAMDGDTGVRRSVCRFAAKGGGQVWLELSMTAALDADGKATEMVAVGRDVSRRMEAEAALAQAKERLEIALDASGLGVWDWNFATGDVAFDAGWLALLGYVKGEVEESLDTFMRLAHPEDAQRVLAAFKDYAAGRTPRFREELRMRHKNGGWVWIMTRGKVVERDAHGAPLRAIGTHVDIGYRREMEEQLRRAQEDLAARVEERTRDLKRANRELSRFRAALDASADAVFLIDWTAMRFVDVNHTACAVLGYSREELLDMGPADIKPEMREEDLAARFREVAEAGEGLVIFETLHRRKDGGSFPVEVALRPWRDPEQAEAHGNTLLVALARNITERKKAEQQLQLFAQIFRHSLEGITITDADGTIVDVNPAFTEITGYSRKEALGKNPRILRSDRHQDAFYREMWRGLKEDGAWEGEIWNRRKGGEVYPEWLSISAIEDEEGETSHYVAVFHDISEFKRSQERIQYQAHHDALTDLPNRSLLLDRLEMAISRAERNDQMVALLFLDLDDFKRINDSLGHHVGDQLLMAVAERLSHAVRAGDTVARLGGDEFLVMAPEVADAQDALLLAERLLACFEGPFRLQGHALHVSTSIGVSFYPDDGADAGALIKNADLAMYRAKEKGKNNIRLFTPAMNEKAQRRLALESQLRRALDRGDFEVHYQPKVLAESGRVAGMEALVRWRREDGGVLASPAEFIPLAEETGLIVPLGELVLDKALAFTASLAELPAAKGLDVSVNLSPRQFQQRKLARVIAGRLAASGLSPERLELEITESTLMRDTKAAVDILSSMAETGVTFSVDDFGTGYSSLYYLKHFNLHVLKVDKSFVDGLPGEAGDANLVATIIMMARNFSMQVVAEGVETMEQLDFLRGQGCDLVQGYLFSKPLPPGEMRAVIEAGGVLRPGGAGA